MITMKVYKKNERPLGESVPLWQVKEQAILQKILQKAGKTIAKAKEVTVTDQAFLFRIQIECFEKLDAKWESNKNNKNNWGDYELHHMKPNSMSGSNEDCSKIPLALLDHTECHGCIAVVTGAPEIFMAFNLMTMPIQWDQGLSLA